MRRSLSNLVMLAMLLPAVAPLLALVPQTVPACCRANGKHHCQMMMKMAGQGFRAQVPPCPYRGRPAVAPAHLALQISGNTFAVNTSRSDLTIGAADEAILHSSYSVPKRGPPLA